MDTKRTLRGSEESRQGAAGFFIAQTSCQTQMAAASLGPGKQRHGLCIISLPSQVVMVSAYVTGFLILVTLPRVWKHQGFCLE